MIFAIVIVAVLLLANANASAADRSASFTAFAESIATAEGFGRAGAVPTLRNNPGDLVGSDGRIRTFATVDDGWRALYHQLDLMRDGESSYYDPTNSIATVATVWTATEQASWARNVVAAMQARGFSVTAQSTLLEVLG